MMTDARRLTVGNPPKNLTLKQAAAYVGLSERTLRRHIAEGRLRAYRVGPRAIRITADDLDALARPIGPQGAA